MGLLSFLGLQQQDRGYRTGVFGGFYYAASVCDAPHFQAINSGGRTFKLEICEGGEWDVDCLIYRYNRHLVFDDTSICDSAPPGLVDQIIAYVESW